MKVEFLYNNFKREILKIVHVAVAVGAFSVLIAPIKSLQILLVILGGMICTVIMHSVYDKLEWNPYIHRELITLDLLIMWMLAYDFYVRWIVSSKVAAIAQLLHISVPILLIIISLVLTCFAISAIDTWLWWIKEKLAILIKRNDRDNLLHNIGIIVGVSVLQFLSIQYSSVSSGYSFLEMMKSYSSMWLLNILIMICLNQLILLMLQKWKISLCVTAIFICIWSIANYYVILFHGSPLYVSELYNAKTAINVAETYTYEISSAVVFAILVLITEVEYIFKHLNLKKYNSFIKRLGERIIVTGMCMVVTLLLLDNCKAKNRWSWKAAVFESGFMVCAMHDFILLSEPVIKPEGYDITIMEDIQIQESNSKKLGNALPDIIVILNESFSDLEYYADINTDRDYLKNFYSIPNAEYGYAVAPSIGGGTNNSEFELLYSKSMYLLSSTAPFTYLDKTLEERSVVEYLNKLGYTTTGMHCGEAENYSRHIAYPAMNFDNVVLGSDAFKHMTNNGNRPWLDKDNYQDLIDYYEKSDSRPQFMYLLTYQNHGGYEQNEDSIDTVHIMEDLGDLTDDVNEYLSSVELSAKAFIELTEYYNDVERDVIICMVGDHAPSFVTSLPAKQEKIIDDDDINMRIVPYVIWKNFDTEIEMYTEYVSMVDLIPMIFEYAQVPMSEFYTYILELHDELPVRTSDGKGVTKDYTIINYSDSVDNKNNCYDMWRYYYYLEYNSLIDNEYNEDYFFVESK